MGARQMIMARKRTQIDRDKLRAAVRKLGDERVFQMLDDAIELLPPAKLCNLAKKYLDLKRLRPDTQPANPPSLLTAVQRFRKASLAGEYYQSFNVNSKNYMDKSVGTRAWIAECLRLLDLCVSSAKGSDSEELRKAMEILFGLLDHVDKCLEDVIFFGDEGGSWQVGANWAAVLPVWFKVLSATAEPDEYAERVKHRVSRHYSHGRDKMLTLARRTATPAQRKALAEVKGT